MQEKIDRQESYDRTTIRLHWLTATLVIILWTMGRTTGWLPRGPLRIDIWSIHIVLGVILIVCVCTRMAWRASRGRKLAPTGSPLLRRAAALTHGLLYLLLLAVLVLGVLNVFSHAFPFFNLWKAPQLGDRQFRHWTNDWHGLGANCLAAVALVHSLAGLFHHFVLRDSTLGRMIPTLSQHR